MISMTGYGYKEIEDAALNCSIEIKSYNNRYLDFNFTMPPFLSPLEPVMKGILSEKISRGRIEVYVRIKELAEDITVHIDEQALKAHMTTLQRCIEVAELKDTITLDHILKIEGVLKTVKNRNVDEMWDRISPAFREALEVFVNSRISEGTETEKDIRKQLSILIDGEKYIRSFANEIEQRLTIDIKEKFEQVTGSNANDEQRILSEIAVLLVKYSINEELQRLNSHLNAFDQISNEPGPIGKKLDFLCQEINREINTIGSKSMIVEVNQKVVIMKDALENIREQLRNVE